MRFERPFASAAGNTATMSDAPPADEALVRATLAGDEEAFAELGRRYARLVFATCLRETQNRSLAEDAAQGVFLLLSQKAVSLQRLDSLAGWLYTAARHVSRNLLKQERRRERIEVRAMEDALSQPNPGNPLWEQIEPHFHAALDRLKPADRTAILLRYVQDESLAEVGTRLGIPENTARMRIHRAMEKLRAHLAQVLAHQLKATAHCGEFSALLMHRSLVQWQCLQSQAREAARNFLQRAQCLDESGVDASEHGGASLCRRSTELAAVGQAVVGFVQLLRERGPAAE